MVDHVTVGCGILFVLHTGIQEAGVREQLHVLLWKKLRSAKKLDWSRAVIDSSHLRAARRDPKAVPARSTALGRAADTTSSPTPRAPRSQCR
ncbi:hypothetical protein GCM10022403_071740 [Streptomyces coacervatus]|uniref:Transposase n=1 Tax=Streptomyces coacervatus TaxID=647381 RepID=A0ABP7IWP5_9ACTN